MVIKSSVFMNYNKLYEITTSIDGYTVDTLIFWHFLANQFVRSNQRLIILIYKNSQTLM